MRRFSCLIIFLTLILCCKGRDPGVVTGEVTSKEDGRVVQGVEVVVRETGQSAVTDRSGMYTLKGITEGDFILCFTHIKYDTIEVFVSGMVEGEEFLISVAMQKRE